MYFVYDMCALCVHCACKLCIRSALSLLLVCCRRNTKHTRKTCGFVCTVYMCFVCIADTILNLRKDCGCVIIVLTCLFIVCVFQTLLQACEKNLRDHQVYRDAYMAASDWLGATTDKLNMCSDVRGDRSAIEAQLHKVQVSPLRNLPCVCCIVCLLFCLFVCFADCFSYHRNILDVFCSYSR